MDKLIELAESLNAARYDANAIEATAPTADAYGSISEALKKVLAHIVGVDAQEVYEYMIDNGEGVRYNLTMGYDVVPSYRSNAWKVVRDGETIGRIYLDKAGFYSPERAIDRVLAEVQTLDAAKFAIVQSYRADKANR
jgi:hypothetical protein